MDDDAGSPPGDWSNYRQGAATAELAADAPAAAEAQAGMATKMLPVAGTFLMASFNWLPVGFADQPEEAD